MKHAVLSIGISNMYYSRSAWRSDLLSIESKLSTPILSNSCVFDLGNGVDIPFWSGNWMNAGRLLDLFPMLYKASSDRGGSVNSMGARLGSDWVSGSFGINLSNLDLSQEVLDLRGIIEGVIPSVSGLDKIQWLIDK